MPFAHVAPARVPRVSIGLPVFNGEAFLREAIDSVLGQSFTDLELVISDNASTDATAEICREYVARDSRVRYHCNDRNMGAARNYGRAFALARGEYFKWLAADDRIAPDFLSRAVEILDCEASVAIALSRYTAIDERGQVLRTLDYDHEFRGSAPARIRKLFDHPQGTEHPHWGLLRTSVARKTGLLRTFIGSDFFLSFELVLHGETVQMPDHLIHFRIHDGAYSKKLRKENRRDGMQGEAEAKWLDPGNRGSLFLPHWNLVAQYFKAIAGSKHRISHRVAMLLSLVYPLAFRWRLMLLKEALFAARLGGAYVRIRDVWRKAFPRAEDPSGQTV
jgi:glycosyltransferase involved in cell wall biosynthesis